MDNVLKKECSSGRPAFGLRLSVTVGAMFISVAAGCSGNESISTRGKTPAGDDSKGVPVGSVTVPFSVSEGSPSADGLNLADPAAIRYRIHLIGKYKKEFRNGSTVSAVDAFVKLGHDQVSGALLPSPANSITAEVGSTVTLQKLYLMGLKPSSADPAYVAMANCNPEVAETNCVVLDKETLSKKVSVSHRGNTYDYTVSMGQGVFGPVRVDANGVGISIPYVVKQELNAKGIDGLVIGNEGVEVGQLESVGQAAPQVSRSPTSATAQRVSKNGASLVVIEFEVSCSEVNSDCPTKVESIALTAGPTFNANSAVKLANKAVLDNQACNKDTLDANNQFCFKIVDDASFALNKRRFVRMAMSGLQEGANNSFQVKLVREDSKGGKGASVYTWNSVMVRLPGPN